MNLRVYYAVIFLSLAAALGIGLRATVQKSNFDHVVNEAHKTSEGYDQKFIDMVNRLEEELATRASFGFLGGKDPMTGQVRHVVSAPAPTPRGAGRPGAKAAPALAKRADPFRLTAIIFDDNHKQYTAIVMDGERSFSVENGDVVSGRKVIQITQNGIMLEGPTALYFYDIRGNRQEKQK